MTPGPHRSAVPYVLAAVAGALVWVATAALEGKREAWDGALYFAFGLPVLVSVCFALGWHFRRHAWRWGVAAIAAQLAIVLASASDLQLFPLGVALFTVLMIPCALAALLGAWLGRRYGRVPIDRHGRPR